MKIISIFSNVESKFGTRKPNEREYADHAGLLESYSRPLSSQERLIKISQKRRIQIIHRDLLFLVLLVITIGAIMVAVNVFGIVIWPVKIVIFAVVVLLWFWFWFSGLD